MQKKHVWGIAGVVVGLFLAASGHAGKLGSKLGM